MKHGDTFSLEAADAPRRIYHFPLPYRIEAVMVHYGVIKLRNEGVFDSLPEDLQGRMKHADESWLPLRVTADDLNRIPTPAWTAIASSLRLEWEEEQEA